MLSAKYTDGGMRKGKQTGTNRRNSASKGKKKRYVQKKVFEQDESEPEEMYNEMTRPHEIAKAHDEWSQQELNRGMAEAGNSQEGN